ncbi:hypothetical protein M408DRAFT_334309 [Serendipita vermifera MAFF 305830]|uniref:Uncharacterized protein n=1 Tax=Serendipita vermifera MAFF 305830 TaxID=933852 RepID=A0A0C2VZG7_SERVB|nr:hypothetical protein M408DRAFT_334309 [Serendipita vermifera MAFF 305830]
MPVLSTGFVRVRWIYESGSNGSEWRPQGLSMNGKQDEVGHAGAPIFENDRSYSIRVRLNDGCILDRKDLSEI